MGGRGTYASGNNVPYSYKTIGFTKNGIKILEGLDGKHGLPEEAHSSRLYASLNKDGTVRTIRIYDKSGRLVLEIANHPEPKLDQTGANVLHFHLYDENFNRTKAQEATAFMRRKFGTLFAEVQL